MIGKLKNKIALILELYRKYKVLRNQDLLDDRVTAEELEKYLFMCNGIGRHRGYLRSLREGMCVDKNGSPIPWYTYPAIEQLSRWDFSDAEVFEYGCGNSTRWWANRAKSVVSVESSEAWYENILASKVLPSNTTPLLAPISGPDRISALKDYANTLSKFGSFDVIVVDGETENRIRYTCAEIAITHLKKGGIIILDNSDWHPDTSKLLRDSGLLQIDFCGYGPLNTTAEITSLFLHKDFRIRPLSVDHPGFVIAGMEYSWG